MIAGNIIGISHYQNKGELRLLVRNKEDSKDITLYTKDGQDIKLDDFIWTQSNSIMQTRDIDGKRIFHDRVLKRIKRKNHDENDCTHAVEFYS